MDPSPPAPAAAPELAPLPTTPVPAPRVTAGQLVGRAFSTWRACFLPFAALGLMFQGIAMALGWALGSPAGLLSGTSPFRQSPELLAWTFSGRYWAYLAATMLLSVVFMGGLTGGAVQHLAGRPVTVGAMIGSTIRRLPRLAAAGALALVLVYLGFLLLLVPGILWGLSYSLTAPVVMAEERGAWASLKRSRALAKGSRATLFAAYFICGVAGTAATYLGMGLTLAAPLPGGVVALAGNVLLGPILWVAPAVAYHGLRVAKEGASSAELARVFE